MRILLPVLSVVALVACQPQSAGNVGGGVGFQDYSAYQQQQAYLARSRSAPPPAPQTAARGPDAPLPASVVAAVESANAGAGQEPVIQRAGQPTAAQPTAGAGEPLSALRPNAGGISDEQSFEAVSARETIESDRERLERQRAEYQVVAPTPVPERSGPSGPNIAEFALSTSHPVGQQMYRRSNPFRNANWERNCARYASDALAQEAFLGAGGPERDRLNLDPDGDGYACRWDPSPFRFNRG